MNSLKTKPDKEFTNWLLRNLYAGKRYEGNKWSDDFTFLPYTGTDPDIIRHLLLESINLVYPEYRIDEYSLKIINVLVETFVSKESKNGVVLRGLCGVGKTSTEYIWFEFLQKVLALEFPNKEELEEGFYRERELEILMLDPAKLVTLYRKFEHSLFGEIIPNNRSKVMFVDDLGFVSTITHFGMEINILEELIYARYEVFKRNPTFEFYGTTNLTSSKLQKLVGERAMSRLLEMTEWDKGFFDGSDRRKQPNPLKQWPAIKEINLLAKNDPGHKMIRVLK